MKQIFINLFYWIADYLYVAKEEIGGLLDPDKSVNYRLHGGESIILIPGVYEGWHFVKPIARLLYKHGYDVHIVDDLGYNRGTVEEMAEVVKKYITKQSLHNVTIISHSKGGLIGKYLLAMVPEPVVINKLIALNAPFSGSKYAYLLPFRTLRIFTPNSKILTELALDTISNSRIVSIFRKFDPHIPGGSMLNGAKNVQLNTYGHFRIINDSKVHNAILLNLKPTIK